MKNTNTLARFYATFSRRIDSLLIIFHYPVAPPDYDMAEAIKICEGKYLPQFRIKDALKENYSELMNYCFDRLLSHAKKQRRFMVYAEMIPKM